MSAGPHVAETLHKQVKFLDATDLADIRFQPFLEGSVQGPVQGASNQLGLLVQVIIAAKSHSFHIYIVYFIFVLNLPAS